MKVATFYPGPSRVYSQIPKYIYEAYMEGIMSVNHRSTAFMDMLMMTKNVLKAKLLIPDDYEIVFTSSATECWEIIAQSLTTKKSQHFFNGAFGEKWYEYAGKLTNVEAVKFGLEEELPVNRADPQADVICFTQNETSNGSQVGLDTIAQLREESGDALIAVDVTSSLGGIYLDFSKADIWYGSCQKCLGLPSGLGVLILSPRAVAKAYATNERLHYNSLASILDNAQKNQTAYTPNVLSIYLLLRTQQVSKGIMEIEKKLLTRKAEYENTLKKLPEFAFLIQNPALRSTTVLTVAHKRPDEVKKHAQKADLILGNGYGSWKESTFRIANFPAIKTREVERLTKFLKKNYEI